MENRNYKEQNRLAFVGFILELPNLALVTASFVMTTSVVLLVDFLDSLSNTLKELFMCILSRRLGKNLKYKYNFGITKVEALSSLLCDAVLMFGLLIAAGIGIYEIINPVKVSGLLAYAVALKVLNVAIDIVYLIKQGNVHKKMNTALTAAEYMNCRKNVAFDGSVLVTTLACALFSEHAFSMYIAPVVSIGISVFLGIAVVKRILKCVPELTERTLGEEYQLVLCRICAKHFSSYRELKAVRSKIMGNRLYVEFDLEFEPDTTYEEIRLLGEDLQKQVTEEFGESSVSITVSSE